MADPSGFAVVLEDLVALQCSTCDKEWLDEFLSAFAAQPAGDFVNRLCDRCGATLHAEGTGAGIVFSGLRPEPEPDPRTLAAYLAS